MNRPVNLERALVGHLPKRGFVLLQLGESWYFVRKGFRLLPCDGAAHSNPHIDNCQRCMPEWGVIAVKDD